MKSCHEIWNVLHDGCITATAGTCPGELSLRVEIAYLCEVLAKGTTSLWVHLQACRRAQYTPFGSREPLPDIAALAGLEVELLSATERDDEVTVLCTDGELRLGYADARYELEGGARVDFDAITRASESYWEDWERRNAGPAAP